jgi:hypothetical protein
MRRSDALAEELISAGKCPVQALVRLAERAETEGDLAQAIGAWRSVLPYIYPKPKAVEIEPEEVIELARGLAEIRANAATNIVENDHVALVENFLREREYLS